MPKLIFISPYLKGGNNKNKSKILNLVKYISTREGVETNIQKLNVKVSNSQENLINEITKEYPLTKKLFEYEDYINNKTVANANEFIKISLEQNLNFIDKKKNYIDYISNRPNVEKRDTHGLFTSGVEKINLKKVAEKVANHKGNIWTPVISLKREDAEKTGYDKAEKFKILLEKNAVKMAEYYKIPIEKFCWYGAFHNEGHHPHIHMIIYSKDEKSGYLTEKGIENIKSSLVKEIFMEELNLIYKDQTMIRNKLKKEAENMFKNSLYNENLEHLILKLKEELKNNKGKKQYGYLKPNVKNIVDEIARVLGENETIKNMYDMWYDLKYEIYSSYKDTMPEKIPLEKQKEFKSIKNMIIKEVLNMDNEINIAMADEKIETENLETNIEEIDLNLQNEILNKSEFLEENIISESKTYDKKDYHIDWNENYKQAKKYLVGTKKIAPNIEQAVKLFEVEVNNKNVLAMFDMAEIYNKGLGENIDKTKAENYYKIALDKFIMIDKKKANNYLKYRIGKMYLQGWGTNIDYEKAVEYFKKAAEENYKYANYSLAGLYFEGKGIEKDIEKSFKLYLKSANQDIPYAQYKAGKMYKNGLGTEKDEEKSNEYLKRAFKNFRQLEEEVNDDKLMYKLGSMLEKGIGTEVNIKQAIEYYEKSANLKNSYALYNLGKIYLMGNSVLKDREKAIEYFKLSAEQGNENAKWFLENIDKFKEVSTFMCITKLFNHLGKIFENSSFKNNELMPKIDSKLLKKMKMKKLAQGQKISNYDIKA